MYIGNCTKKEPIFGMRLKIQCVTNWQYHDNSPQFFIH